MAVKNVLIEIQRKAAFEASLFGSGLIGQKALETASSMAGSIPGFTLDQQFSPIPAPPSSAAAAPFTMDPSDASYETVLLRGTIDEDIASPESLALGANAGQYAVYADPFIEPYITCGDSPPIGTAADVGRLLGRSELHRAGMEGQGVLLAIVDTGINLAHLQGLGLNPRLDASMSWVPPLQPGQSPMVPGQMPPGHGTMCAFDALIAAPAATLLDIAILASRRPGGSPMEGLLSDAVLGYSHLLRVLRNLTRPGGFRSLVISNSWGMFRQSWDFPKGHPGNYSHNLDHPFNRIVATLERAGADILFAAGNCGKECPDGRCGNETSAGIYGANSHPSVISVAGTDIRKERVGYSTRGPGKLSARKPDIACYTHFSGSQIYPADGGTSAATPVAAGLVAAIRSRYPSSPERSPALMRKMIRSTAEDAGRSGFDHETGHGIVRGPELAQAWAKHKSKTPPSSPPDQPPDQGSIPMDQDSNITDADFMDALRAFPLPGSTPAATTACCPGCSEQSARLTFSQESMMNEVSDQEFLNALNAFDPANSLAASMGMAGTGAAAAVEDAEPDDQAFMAALSVYGGPSAASLSAVAGVGAINAAAAPSLAQVCSVWRTVRPIAMRIIPFIGALPGIGSAVVAAFRTLAGILDTACGGGPFSAATLCQKWRGGLRTIVARIASVVGSIPLIGSGARNALNTLIGAVDTLCRGV